MKLSHLFDTEKKEPLDSELNLQAKNDSKNINDASPTLKERINLAESKQKIGWVSPSYSVSRPVKLDPRLMERNRCVALFPDNAEIESYKVLRTRIQRRTEIRGGNTIMVTSTLPGEGKTLTAINLALTFATQFEQTVILVDGDLKRQNVHKVLGYESDKGLVNYLTGECDMPDLIVWPGIEKLTIISGGRTIHESSEILGSPRMREMVDDMKKRYSDRVIFFDAPPILAGADAISLMPLVDHVLIVVLADQTPMTELKKALELVPPDKILGLAFNQSTSENHDYYYYGYAYSPKGSREKHSRKRK